jgi:hypothetical protein
MRTIVDHWVQIVDVTSVIQGGILCWNPIREGTAQMRPATNTTATNQYGGNQLTADAARDVLFHRPKSIGEEITVVEECRHSRVSRSGPALREKWNPPRHWGSPFLRCTIPLMKKARSSSSRRRLGQPLARKTFVYLTEEERRLVDQAAASERRSVSSFVANAAVEAAERIVSRPPRKK